MSMKFYRNIRTGETGYIDVKENRQYFDASKIRTGECPADYEFKHFALHIAIAGITGLIAAAISDSTVLGILIGIASLVICTIIHLIKEGELFDTTVRKNIIVKKMIAYTATIGIAIAITAICNSIGTIAAAIAIPVTLIAVIIIIKKIDD